MSDRRSATSKAWCRLGSLSGRYAVEGIGHTVSAACGPNFSRIASSAGNFQEVKNDQTYYAIRQFDHGRNWDDDCGRVLDGSVDGSHGRRVDMPLSARARIPESQYRNRLEEEYMSNVVTQWKLAGDIIAWDYEPISFRYGHNARYLPDFMLIRKDGLVEFHEVKGSPHQKNARAQRCAMKACARKYPWFIFVFACKKKVPGKKGRQWTWETIKP